MKKQKTLHLSDDCRLKGGIVEMFAYLGTTEPIDYSDDAPEPEYIYDWKPTKYKIGVKVMLVSRTNVSPNSIRRGDNVPCYDVVFDAPDGIPGNSNRNITRYHGWRGTNNDIYLNAHGLREIIAIRELKNGVVSVTLGPDILPDEE